MRTLSRGARLAFTAAWVAMLGFGLTVGSQAMGAADPTSLALAQLTTTTRVAGQGCTPGFFKNHTGAFTAPYTTDRLVGATFTGVVPSLASETLEEALSFQGGPDLEGKQEILLRAAVAALLNAAHPSINYPLSPDEVTSMVNAAIAEAAASGDLSVLTDLADELDALNNGECPLSGGNTNRRSRS